MARALLAPWSSTATIFAVVASVGVATAAAILIATVSSTTRAHGIGPSSHGGGVRRAWTWSTKNFTFGEMWRVLA